jgi:hypothetical protein
MVLTYFLNDFEMVPVAPIITGLLLLLLFHIKLCNSWLFIDIQTNYKINPYSRSFFSKVAAH